MFLSIIIPVYNEEDNIIPLIQNIRESLVDIKHEIIFVDDGSNDNTAANIVNASKNNHNITLVKLRRNFGQTPALAAGIDFANGDYIVTIDGDLQNDPADIPKMLNYLIENNYDIVTGVRKKRKDGCCRVFLSKMANKLIRFLTNVKITDYGCTLKVFKTSLARRLELYGELHRFIPVLAQIYGAKIGEIEVNHLPRIHGQSKYGVDRTLRVSSDLLLMYYFQKYQQKPMHLFGNLGIILFLAGGLIETYLLILKMFGTPIAGRPLFYLGILLILAAFQFITTGFLAELMSRTWYSAQNKKIYEVEEVTNINTR